MYAFTKNGIRLILGHSEGHRQGVLTKTQFHWDKFRILSDYFLMATKVKLQPQAGVKTTLPKFFRPSI